MIRGELGGGGLGQAGGGLGQAGGGLGEVGERLAAPTGLDVGRVLAGARLVLIGGTGFLGKILWAMLLDRYPDVGRIYLVVRPKEEANAEARFAAEVVKSEVLEPLRRAHGDAFEAFLRSKVVPIEGDTGRPLCGLDDAIVRELRGTIDAVVNVAGIVDFNPPLDEALESNAFGAHNVVGLARALGDVPLLHTSTCYVAGKRPGPIREEDPCAVPFPRASELGAELWDPAREIDECLQLVAQANHRAGDAFRQSGFAEQAREKLLARGEPTHGPAFDRELAHVKRKFVREELIAAGLDRATHWGWSNIYLYTKAIGEQIVAKSGLEFTIARPACCESCVEFPMAAYNEGGNTSAPLIYLMMKGHLQILAQHVPLDLIPTDYVVAGMILSLAELLEGTAPAVYQFGASDINPCTAVRFGELVGLYKRKHFRRKGSGHPFLNALQARFEPSFVDRRRFDVTGDQVIASVTRAGASFVRERVPGLGSLAAALENVAKREDKIAEVQLLFEPFAAQMNGPFDCSNVRAAFARLSPEDRAKLPWTPEAIDWADWMMNVHMPAMEKRIVPEMDKKLAKPARALEPYPTLVALVDEMAERHDVALALRAIANDGLTRVTFADVKRGAEAVAGRLAEIGVGKDDRVALSGQNHPDWAIAYFGILRAGATAVPVDPAMEPDGWRTILAESGARAVLWDDTVKARRARQTGQTEQTGPTKPIEQGPRGGPADGVASFDLHEVVSEEGAPPPPVVAISAGDVASILFTSGTTGRPKGVMLTHANFTSLVASLATIFPLSPGDAVVSVLPLHHTFEFTCGLLLPMSRGAHVVYVGEPKGDRVAQALRASRAKAMVGVPALWQMLERRILRAADDRGPFGRAVFDSALEMSRWLAENAGVDIGRVLFGPVHAELGGNVRWLVSGGAALPRETQELFLGLGLGLTQGYGLTEAAPVLTVARPGKRVDPGVGKAVPGVEVKIASPDGEGVGEIIARGPNVMLGYAGGVAPETVDEDGWLRTGDLGRIDRKGRLEIVGRTKDVVISPTGENVYPEDVERRLGAVRYVSELAIVGIELRGGERLACLAVAADDDTVSRPARVDRARGELRRAIDELPAPQRPAVVHFYEAALPRTATRKVKRDAVREILVRMVSASAPREEAEREVGLARATIAGLRDLALAEVQPHTTLQGELGFDSLMMTELLEALETRCGALDAARLQACLTVGEVEQLVAEGAGGRAAASIEPDPEAPSYVLPDPVAAAGKAILGRCLNAFYGDVMKPEVSGQSFIPYNRNVIVAANHASHLDMGFVRYALGKYGEDIVSLAAQDYFFENGIKRAFFENFTNLKPFDRRASLRQAIRQAGEVIERGKTVLLFPEGTRSASGEVGEFKPLVGYLALAHGVDILPIHLGGTHAAMSKGSRLPTRREIVARIGPPLCVADLRRVTEGMPAAPAAREVARLAQMAVLALRDGRPFDLSREVLAPRDPAPALEERVHPIAKLFSELEAKFRAGEVERPVSFYVTLGSDDSSKWTVRVDPNGCDVRPGKPDGGQADCVLKTTPEIFARIVREAYVPSPADFLSGAVKSNDVSLLLTFQRVFQLDRAS
jgi:long-chain acyl-CoA synthetase